MVKKVLKGWYPVSPVGRVAVAAYVCIPAYVATSQWLGVFPQALTGPLVGGMAVVMVCAAVARQQKKPLFKDKHGSDGGFTLVELLVVISIIGMLATILFPQVISARKGAQLARAKAELRNLAVALEEYANDNGGYPPDVNRGLPPGLEKYLAGGKWPPAPWPGAVYDWDNWSPSDLSFDPKQQTYQLSIRFCSSASVCNFPDDAWAQDFDYYSSAYYCISGSCRAHSSRPLSHPSYCLNCGN